MSLFEAGILDRMTSMEYEKMFGVQNVKIGGPSLENVDENSGTSKPAEPEGAQKSAVGEQKTQKVGENNKLEPISLMMVQGAFLVLMAGYSVAMIILGLEVLEHRHRCLHLTWLRARRCCSGLRHWLGGALRRTRRLLMNLYHFQAGV